MMGFGCVSIIFGALLFVVLAGVAIGYGVWLLTARLRGSQGPSEGLGATNAAGVNQ